MIDPIDIRLRHKTGNVPYGRPRNAPSHPTGSLTVRERHGRAIFRVRPLFVKWEE